MKVALFYFIAIKMLVATRPAGLKPERGDLRRWGGGRESSFVYHYAKKAALPLVIVAWVVYLALPFSLHPSWLILPFAIGFSLVVTVTASAFKKHL